MDRISLSAYAKINLSLSITGKREDGYHTLESVMQEISLADTVSLERIPCGILLSCNKEGIPTNEKNLCWKAARAYLDAAKIQGGVKIDLIKRIPDGAGMGGGSSDAAAVLKAMQCLYPSKVSLPEIALKIGADVPFFLSGKTALCKGIGEELTPISFRGKDAIFCVAAKNCEGLSTPSIYRLYDETVSEPRVGDTKSFQKALEAGDREAILRLMQNDLEPIAIVLRPQIALLKGILLSLGANGAMMTGSGSAVFGLFFSREKAIQCAETLNKEGVEAHFCTLI
jgi:4-diphosphocytidyl-2-C-methyl-D-erythritol kinase